MPLLVFLAIYAYPLFNSFLTPGGVIGIIVDVFLFSVFPCACLYFLWDRDPLFRARLRRDLTRISWGSMAFLLLYGTVYAYLAIFAAAYFQWGGGGESISNEIARSGLMGVVYLALSAALIEEVLYKTLLNHALPVELGDIAFSIVSGVAFGVAHMEQGVVMASMAALFFGMPTAYYYRARKSIVGLVVMHFLVDFMVFGWLWAWSAVPAQGFKNSMF